MILSTPSTWKRTPAQATAEMVELLGVEELDRDLYRGPRLPNGKGRVFGGQVIAQALQAAQRSSEAKIAHSLHAYFMRAGDGMSPIIYRVVRDFEGKSFATRRVIATQKGEPILNLAASFQLIEEGLHHQDELPDVPPPEDLLSDIELSTRSTREAGPEAPRYARPIEIRPVFPENRTNPKPRSPIDYNWIRCAAPIGDDPALHRAVLAYLSDMPLLATSMIPHGAYYQTPGMQTASLDHALWIHEPFRADEWMLYATNSPWSGHGRGMNRGTIYTRDGRLIASVAQEALIRRRIPPS